RHKDPRCQNCTPRGNPPLTDPGSPPRRRIYFARTATPGHYLHRTQTLSLAIMSAACTLDFPTVPFPPRAGARGVAVAYAGGRGQAIVWIACWTQAPVRRYAVRFRAVPNWIAQLGQSNGFLIRLSWVRFPLQTT